MGSILYAGRTDTGRVRSENQDSWYAEPEQGLFIVSDGMGGHAGGEVASRIVVEGLPPLLRQRLGPIKDLNPREVASAVNSAVAEVSELVIRETHRRPELYGMGATVVLALVRGRQVLIAHLGDSRAYFFSKKRLSRLTRDHSLVQILVDTGHITPDEARVHPARGQITRAVGVDAEVVMDVKVITAAPGDRLLLCCDGLTDMIEDAAIASILEKDGEPKKICADLVDSANKAGGRDNITVVLLEWR